MFAPMSPMTERIRNQNERQLSEHRASTFALPKLNVAPLRKLFGVRRPATARQPRTASETSGC